MATLERRYACRVLGSFVKGASAPAPPAGLRWKQLDRVMGRANLSPVFRHALGKDNLPPEYAKAWKGAALAFMLKNARILRVGARFLALLEQEGIPAVAMRGVALTQNTYPAPGLRTMRDIDILLPSGDRDRIVGVLGKHGLQPWKTLRSQFVYKPDGIEVEIHWLLLTPKRYRLAFDTTPWFDSRRAVDTPEGTIHCLAPEHELLGLVTHAFIHHELNEFASLIDIGLVMVRDDLDWDYLAGWCADAGLTRMFLFTFAFTDWLLGLGLSDRFTKLGGRLPAQTKRVFEAYAAPLFAQDRMIHFTRRKRTELFVAERPAVKLKQLIRFASASELRHASRLRM